MTPEKFATYIRGKTNTNSTTFTDAQIMALANPIKDEIALDIVDIDEDLLLIPKTADLAVNQREYPLPTDMVGGFRSVYAKLDGTNFIKLKEKRFQDIGHPLEESEITLRYANLEGEAYFMKYRRSIFILSGTISTTVGGLKIYPQEFPSDLSDLSLTTDMSIDPSTTANGIPRELHRVWADMVSAMWKQSRPVPLPLDGDEQGAYQRKEMIINKLHTQYQNGETIFSISMKDMWNDGQDL